MICRWLVKVFVISFYYKHFTNKSFFYVILQTFLAQKYGYRPFPAKIDAEEFEKILEGVENNDDKTLLTDWFVRDSNIVPPVYQLTPIRQKLPDYANDENPELKKKVIDP